MNYGQIRAVVNNNPEQFEFGSVITEAAMLRMFGVARPNMEGANSDEVIRNINNFCLARAKAYTSANKVLIEDGKVIRQATDKETSAVSYQVLTMENTVKKIKSYRKQGDSLKKRSTSLRRNLRAVIR